MVAYSCTCGFGRSVTSWASCCSTALKMARWRFGSLRVLAVWLVWSKILQKVYPTTQAKHSSFSSFVAICFSYYPDPSHSLSLSLPAFAVEGLANTKHRNPRNSGGNTESSAGNSIVRIPLASTLECPKTEASGKRDCYAIFLLAIFSCSWWKHLFMIIWL